MIDIDKTEKQVKLLQSKSFIRMQLGLPEVLELIELVRKERERAEAYKTMQRETAKAGREIRAERDAALAAADAVVTVDGLQERIEDTLAYYQCRETNPKADHPSMGYHAFSEEQREFLRARKSEAAAEIVRMILTLLRGGEDDEAVA